MGMGDAGAKARRVANFQAGPAQLPVPVLGQAARAMTDVTPDGAGVSIAELGHRTEQFERNGRGAAVSRPEIRLTIRR